MQTLYPGETTAKKTLDEFDQLIGRMAQTVQNSLEGIEAKAKSELERFYALGGAVCR